MSAWARRSLAKLPSLRPGSCGDQQDLKGCSQSLRHQWPLKAVGILCVISFLRNRKFFFFFNYYSEHWKLKKSKNIFHVLLQHVDKKAELSVVQFTMQAHK